MPAKTTPPSDHHNHFRERRATGATAGAKGADNGCTGIGVMGGVAGVPGGVNGGVLLKIGSGVVIVGGTWWRKSIALKTKLARLVK